MTIELVGVVERRQPLPPGRYWITVSSSPSAPDRMTHFLQWTAANAQTVIVDKTEPMGGGVNGLFCIFTVLQKTAWDAKQFGFPNVAGPDVQTSDDTVQRPPKPTAGGMISDVLADLFATPVGKLALIGALAFLFGKASRK
jgi:hypothetical protein